MFRTFTALALLLFAQSAAAFAAPPPAGGVPIGPPAAPPVMATMPPAQSGCADPALVSASVTNTAPQGNLNLYTITGTVTNEGAADQDKNVIQSVDIFMGTGKTAQKLDQKGIPPLTSGQSYNFTYTASRSSQAGNGTTQLVFKLDMTQPNPPGQQDCNPRNDSFTLRF